MPGGENHLVCESGFGGREEEDGVVYMCGFDWVKPGFGLRVVGPG